MARKDYPPDTGQMTLCYIGIGSNVGDRRHFVNEAIKALNLTKSTSVNRISSIYETEAVSDLPQRPFLNGVVEIRTGLRPRELLKELNRIEAELGRIRLLKNGPRTIDLDILYYGDMAIDEKGLIVPHPRIREREFVLRGLRELGKV